MKASLKQTLDEIENALFHGSVVEARSLLQDVFHARIDRKDLSVVANLMRLADFPEKGVQLLHRYVRPSEGSAERATPLERAVYAAALGEMGGVFESLKILSELDSKKLSRVLFYQALNHIYTWNWTAAVPLLEANMVHPKADRYERLAAQVWLGGALTMGFEDHVRAQKLLERALTETSATQRRFLRKHALRFLIQNHYYQRNFKPAFEAINELEGYADADRDRYNKAVALQWSAMLALATKKDMKTFVREIDRVRGLFFDLKRWEEVRQCDFFKAGFLRDEKLLLHLYAGTPHSILRGRVAKLLKSSKKNPAFYDWALGGGTTQQILDVSNGQNSFSSGYLKEGQIQQRMLQVLSVDFYKPLKVAEIHERLYPGDFFNPISSPDRVHQAFRRLRQWLKKNRVPLAVEENGGFYSFKTEVADFGLRISFSEPAEAMPRPSVRLLRLLAKAEEKYGTNEFSAVDFAQCVRMSHPSAVRFLRAAATSKLVIRKGAGPATRYKISI